MHRNVTHKEMSNSLKLANRASHLAFNAKAISQLKLCDHIIAPKSLSNYTLFDTDKFDEIYQIGYSETIKYLKQADIKIA